MDIIKFIKEKVAEAGSQTTISRKTGVSQGTIAKICNGDTNPELGTINKVASAYGLPLSYFLGENKGPVFGIGIDDITNKPVSRRRFPIISNVNGGAGTGVYWVNETQCDYISGPDDLTDPAAFAMRVVGESMAPKYTEGMIVYASPAAEIINGDFVVVQLQNHERIVKRYQRHGETIILESLNTAFAPVVVNHYEIVHIAKVTHSKEK